MNDGPAPDGVVSLERTGSVLERVAAQLAGCAQSMRDLQVSLSPRLLTSMSLDSAGVRQIQDLDAIEQTLTSLSSFVFELGARLPTLDEGQLDRLIGTIPLSNVAVGLRSSVSPHHVPPSGDLEMF